MDSEHTTKLIKEIRASNSRVKYPQALLSVVCDATSEAMIILDEQQSVCWFNRRATDWFVAGCSNSLIGRSFDSLFQFRHLDQRLILVDDQQHPLRQSVHGEGQMDLLVQICDPERSSSTPVQHFMLSWQPLCDSGEHFTLLIFRDLDPLEQALQHQRSFINRLAHELRTPLAIMNGILRRLNRNNDASAYQLRSFEELSSETKRMSGLVDNLLLLSDLDTDRYCWQLEQRSVRSFLSEWLDHLSALQRDLVCVDLDDTVSDSDLCLDQIAVSRVLDNLLENSLRFASDGSQFFIGASIQNHTLTLHVHDQGPPLAINGDASLLFDRFTRLEEHRDPSQTDGVGLGLAVVKSLVEGMGGAVKAEFSSDQAGEKPSGLQISLMFPRVNPTAG